MQQRSRLQELLVCATVVFTWAGLDQLTKGWAVERVGPLEKTGSGRIVAPYGTPTVELIPGAMRARAVGNDGAIWGVGRDLSPQLKRPLFIAVSGIAVGFLLWLFHLSTPEQRMKRAGLALVLSGAMGNLIDRVRLDYVVDFLDWYLYFSWPTFNVADAAITVGIGFVVIDTIRHPDPQPEPELEPEAQARAEEAEASPPTSPSS